MGLRLRVPQIHRLQWKLTLTYTLVTTGAVLVVEAALLLAAWWMLSRSDVWPKLLVPVFQDATSTLAPAIEAVPPDTKQLDAWLEDLLSSGRVRVSQTNERLQIHISPASFSLATITDAQGRVLASVPAGECAQGVFIQKCVSVEAREVIDAALRGESDANQLVLRSQKHIFVATPIVSSDEEVVGAFLVRIHMPGNWAQLPKEVLGTLLSSGLLILLLSVPVGTLFGFFTARGLTRRLNALAQAADAWARGDFSQFVHDSSPDELGQVARRLNRMAEELQNLLQAREEWAALEERHRLARDLHDSVKQQVFATALQIAAARNLLDTEPEQSKQHLVEAERLVRQAQQELTVLIQELRPAALEGKGLAPALQEYVDTWARQTGIHAEVRLRGERALPLPVEQAIFRLVQEALANVAKHSAADRTTVTLEWTQDALVVTVEDNGKGFNVQEAMGRGLGLANMKERVQALGGHIRILSSPGQGTRVEAYVPLSA